MKKKYNVLLCLVILFQWAFAQKNMDQRMIHIAMVQGEITLDGSLDDTGWQNVDTQSEFWMQAPEDGRLAKWKTEVMLAYDAGGIYVGAKMHDENGQINLTLKRDQFLRSDGFAIVLDPTGQQANGFSFGVSSKNAQSEILIADASPDDSWNNKWRSATQTYPDHWVAEMYIPYTSLRFDADSREWGINFYRRDLGLNEVHVWNPIPRQFEPIDLGYCGTMKWDKALGKQGMNVSLIPYISNDLSHTPHSDPPVTNKLNIGGDAKVAITSGLNLDLTINPDFSQVDVDQFQTNLTRFNIFFPERRQFFLENADLFSGYGQFRNQPFYSRRIGLDPRGNTVPIVYGARLSGNLTNKIRIGALNMHSYGQDQNDGQNFTSLAAQYRIGQRSHVKALFLNRQAYDGTEIISGNYGRNLGGEVNLRTPDGKWAGQFGLVQSQKNNISGDNWHIYGRFEYSGEKFRTFLFVQDLGENYYADMGFNARINNFDPINNRIVRIGYTQIGNMLNYYIYPKSSTINYHWSGIENFIIVNDGNDINDWYTRFRHFIFFQNTSELRFRINRHHRELIFPFNLTSTPLPVGEYTNWEGNIEYRSDLRKNLGFSIYSVYGGFFNGNKLTNTLNINFRRQPWGNFTLGIESNRIRLPEPYGDLDITLLTSSVEFNFSTNLYWTIFFQYNTQQNRVNFNSRLQWRYAPMSDLFLVYTDNYASIDGLSPIGRSAVLKATYWLNL